MFFEEYIRFVCCALHNRKKRVDDVIPNLFFDYPGAAALGSVSKSLIPLSILACPPSGRGEKSNFSIMWVFFELFHHSSSALYRTLYSLLLRKTQRAPLPLCERGE